MNITNINNEIYGYKDLEQGEHADFIMKTIEQYEMGKVNNIYNEINKEIKF